MTKPASAPAPELALKPTSQQTLTPKHESVREPEQEPEMELEPERARAGDEDGEKDRDGDGHGVETGPGVETELLM